MTIIEHNPGPAEILDFIDDGCRHLRTEGTEPASILLGIAAYEAIRTALAARLRRSPGQFETYNYLPLVVDPLRSDSVCVLPSAAECAKGIQIVRER